MRSLFAAFLMLLVSLDYGIFMVAMAWVEPPDRMVFVAWSRVSSAVFTFLVAGVFYRRVLFRRDMLVFLRSNFASRELFLLSFGYFDFLVLAFALHLSSPVVVALTYEVWPFFLVLAVSRLTGSVYTPVGLSLVLGFGVAFLGVALAVSSANGGPAGIWRVLVVEGSVGVLFGTSLALLAAVLTGFNCYIWVGSHRLLRSPDLQGPRSRRPLGLFLLLFPAAGWFHVRGRHLRDGSGVSGFCGDPSAWEAVSSFWQPSSASWWPWGAFLWRLATLLTRSSGIHAMAYFTPVFTFALMAAFGFLGGIALLWILAGLSLVILSNLVRCSAGPADVLDQSGVAPSVVSQGVSAPFIYSWLTRLHVGRPCSPLDSRGVWWRSCPGRLRSPVGDAPEEFTRPLPGPDLLQCCVPAQQVGLPLRPSSTWMSFSVSLSVVLIARATLWRLKGIIGCGTFSCPSK